MSHMDAYWNAKVREYHAFNARTFKGVAKAPKDRAVCFETTNFGWILSAADADGKRRVLLKL